jgi:hypothetical protein
MGTRPRLNDFGSLADMTDNVRFSPARFSNTPLQEPGSLQRSQPFPKRLHYGHTIEVLDIEAIIRLKPFGQIFAAQGHRAEGVRLDPLLFGGRCDRRDGKAAVVMMKL